MGVELERGVRASAGQGGEVEGKADGSSHMGTSGGGKAQRYTCDSGGGVDMGGIMRGASEEDTGEAASNVGGNRGGDGNREAKRAARLVQAGTRAEKLI